MTEQKKQGYLLQISEILKLARTKNVPEQIIALGTLGTMKQITTLEVRRSGLTKTEADTVKKSLDEAMDEICELPIRI